MKHIVFILLISITPLAADEKPVLRFSPEYSEVDIGSQTTVEVWIDSVYALKGYSVQFTYDIDKVRILRLREGSMFPSPAFFASFIDSADGIIKIESALLGGDRKVDGSGLLFSIDIYGKSEGIDTLSFFDLNIRDVNLARIDTDSRNGILAIGKPSNVTGRDIIPGSYYLFQNFPNPFNPVTNIRFYLPTSSDVSVTVFNSAGQKITVLLENQMLLSGEHVLIFNGSSLPSGVYYYRIEARSIDGKTSFMNTGRMMLIR
jgi:hypothetical protein